MSIEVSWIYAETFPRLRWRPHTRSFYNAAAEKSDLPRPRPLRSPAEPSPSFEVYMDLVRPYDPRPFF